MRERVYYRIQMGEICIYPRIESIVGQEIPGNPSEQKGIEEGIWALREHLGRHA